MTARYPAIAIRVISMCAFAIVCSNVPASAHQATLSRTVVTHDQSNAFIHRCLLQAIELVCSNPVFSRNFCITETLSSSGTVSIQFSQIFPAIPYKDSRPATKRLVTVDFHGNDIHIKYDRGDIGEEAVNKVTGVPGALEAAINYVYHSNYQGDLGNEFEVSILRDHDSYNIILDPIPYHVDNAILVDIVVRDGTFIASGHHDLGS